ncbi:MAG: M1 family metallopeptidase, partial [Polyangiaceae bacterium]|nr:M1 family metallopeptidase [Polyangiaceae bacterium]
MHLDVAVRVDVAGKTLEVELVTRVQARIAGTRSLGLDAVDLRDLEVELDDGEHAYDGRVLTLSWAKPFVAGEEREAKLRYRVVDPITGVFFSSPNDARPGAPTFAVTDHETERARYWLASLDHPSARPTLDIRITADARLTVLANGAERSREDHEDGTRTTRFAQTEGCPSYLVCFAVGDFARWDGGEHRGIPIAAFAPRPFTSEQVERTWGRTAEMLAFFEERLGVPYPFAKYFQFAAEGIGGAMENISLVSWDDRFVLDETLETEERHLIDIVNVHEMAHSWFGDRVVCRDFAHSWLKEGWATYMESCWLEAKEGADAMAFDLMSHADAYFAEVDQRYRRPIVTRRYSSSFDLFDGHLYPGAALRIHMLRLELGDEVFWSAVRHYLEQHAGATVETDDFRRAIEARSGKSLTQFFDQWFHRPG